MKTSKGTVFKRREGILNRLRTQGEVRVEDLSNEFNVSVITIRRDLELFEKKKMIERIYGGARYIEGAHHQHNEVLPDYETQNPNVDTLSRIVTKALEFVPQEGTIFMSSGYSILELMLRINNPSVRVVTNTTLSINLPFKQTNIIFTGGELSEDKRSFVGDACLHSIQTFEADVCFIGTDGISERLVTSHSLSETIVNRHMIENTHAQRIVVCEGHKIGVEHNFMSCHTSTITHLITDASASPSALQRIKDIGVEVIVVS